MGLGCDAVTGVAFDYSFDLLLFASYIVACLQKYHTLLKYEGLNKESFRELMKELIHSPPSPPNASTPPILAPVTVRCAVCH